MQFFGHFSSGQPTAVGDWLTRKTIEQQLRFVRAHTPSPEIEVLEIGPGRGDFAARLVSEGFRRYDIVEPDGSLRRLCARIPLRQVYTDIIPPIPVASGSYDLVIMCDVFEHMNDPVTALAVLQDIHRVLRPGGRFFVLCPDYNHWGNDFFNCDFSHSNPTTVRRMQQMLYNLDFKPVATTYHYTFLTGLPGWIVGNLIKLLTTPFNGANLGSRFYRLRLCFLRRFLLLAEKLPS